MEQDTGRFDGLSSLRDQAPAGLAHSASIPSAGCAPSDFNDDYRRQVCRIGRGAACCRYLSMGPNGWGCEKRTGMRYAIDARASKMTAQGDNCDGVYDPLPPFVLLKDRFEYKAGQLIYRARGYDYGCASDDEYATGLPHTSMTLEPSGDYPFFTVPNADFEPAKAIEAEGRDGVDGSVHESAAPEGSSPNV